MRIFAIPDIHGRLDLLNKLLDLLRTQENIDYSVDKVVFLGDMIDRGPDSYGVICRILDLCDTYPLNVFALAGNHDLMPVMYYARGKQPWDADLWFQNGGLETIKSYQMAGFSEMTGDHLKWLAFLPLSMSLPGFFFSHAPAPRDSYRLVVNRGQPFTPDELTWTYNRDEWGVARDHGNGIVGVCGHVHALSKGVLAPRFYDHYIYADSGCGCSPKAPLVAIEVNTRKVIFAWP